MSRLGSFVVKGIREALPSTLFFLVLFHMLALTNSVVNHDERLLAERAVGATVGSLIVAKAILIVAALPLSRWFDERRVIQVVWQTILNGLFVLLFKVAETWISRISEDGGPGAAWTALLDDVSWPLFAVTSMWVVAGLLLYNLILVLVREIGPDRVRRILLHKHGDSPAG